MILQNVFFIFTNFLGALLLTISTALAPNNPYTDKKKPFECGYLSFLWQNRIQFSISFFIFALLFLLFDLEVLLVYPYTVSTYINHIYGLINTLLFLLVLIIGFIFELGRKALRIESRQTNDMFIDDNAGYFINSAFIGKSIILLVKYYILKNILPNATGVCYINSDDDSKGGIPRSGINNSNKYVTDWIDSVARETNGTAGPGSAPANTSTSAPANPESETENNTGNARPYTHSDDSSDGVSEYVGGTRFSIGDVNCIMRNNRANDVKGAGDEGEAVDRSRRNREHIGNIDAKIERCDRAEATVLKSAETKLFGRNHVVDLDEDEEDDLTYNGILEDNEAEKQSLLKTRNENVRANELGASKWEKVQKENEWDPALTERDIRRVEREIERQKEIAEIEREMEKNRNQDSSDDEIATNKNSEAPSSPGSPPSNPSNNLVYDDSYDLGTYGLCFRLIIVMLPYIKALITYIRTDINLCKRERGELQVNCINSFKLNYSYFSTKMKNLAISFLNFVYILLLSTRFALMLIPMLRWRFRYTFRLLYLLCVMSIFMYMFMHI